MTGIEPVEIAAGAWQLRPPSSAEARGDRATFSVPEASSGRLAGNVSLWRVDLNDQRSAAIGCRTAPSHAVRDPAACRVPDRTGYRFEGVLRQAFRACGGQRYDEHPHARLAGAPPG